MKKKLRILSVLLLSVLLLGVFSACAPAAAPQQTVPVQSANQTAAPSAETQTALTPTAVGRGLTIGIQSETPSVAPARHTATTGHFKNCLTHNGLFRLTHDTLEPVPDMVESWTALSDTLFEFKLREGMLFHNGEEVSAYDVVASAAYVRTYPIAAPFHGSVVHAEAIDRYTVRIDTGEPNAMLFYELAHQTNFVMPMSLIESGHDFQEDPVGSGPFVFDEWRFGDSLTFVRFDDYFDTERSGNFEYIHWRIIPEGTSRTLALENNEVDFLVDVSFPDLPRLRENPNITVVDHPSTMFSYLLLNNDLPQFNNIHARRAIDMALDKEAMLIASLEGMGMATWQVIPPVFAGATDEGAGHFDPDGARALLAEHGIDPASLAFEMTTTTEEQRRRAEVAQSNLADIGITTTIAMTDSATWLDITRDGNFEAAYGTFTASNVLMFIRSTMHLDSIPAPNRSRIRNEELSDLIFQAVATIDAPSRVAIIEDVSRVANQHIGFIPTNTNVLVRAFNSNLIVPEVSAVAFMLHINMAYWAE